MMIRLIIICQYMDVRASLLEEKDTQPANKSYLSPDMTPIHRYNLFVDCYNMPCNKVQGVELEKIPEPPTYQMLFKISSHLRGKIAFIIVCIIPFADIIPFIFSIFFAYVYWSSLKIHQRNQKKIYDPFRRMRFDPQVCFNMGCDYYFFTIQLKQLQGFSLNYQQNASQRLKLRKERGKTNIMIYNANFWASYNYFQKWKLYHYAPFFVSLALVITFNTLCIFFIVRASSAS